MDQLLTVKAKTTSSSSSSLLDLPLFSKGRKNKVGAARCLIKEADKSFVCSQIAHSKCVFWTCGHMDFLMSS